VREWPRLRSWLDEDQEGQRLFRHLATAAAGWDAAGRPHSERYRGARLQAILEWDARTHPDLTDTERSFLNAGIAHEQDEARAIQQGVGVAMVIALVAGAVALVHATAPPAAPTSNATAPSSPVSWPSQGGSSTATSTSPCCWRWKPAATKTPPRRKAPFSTRSRTTCRRSGRWASTSRPAPPSITPTRRFSAFWPDPPLPGRCSSTPPRSNPSASRCPPAMCWRPRCSCQTVNTFSVTAVRRRSNLAQGWGRRQGEDGQDRRHQGGLSANRW
jgi:hypothetical protein